MKKNMATWSPILYKKEDIAFVFDILHQIADSLSFENDNIESGSLLYGDWGKVIFLANYLNVAENDEIEQKVSDMIDDIHQNTGKKVYEYIAKKNSTIHLDYSFDKGLCGFGWGMNYLIESGFLEDEMNEIMCLADAHTYRRMIEKMYELNINSFNASISNGEYAVSRTDRLSKEYLQRFVSEFYDLKDLYYQKYESESDRATDIARLICLLYKIDVKHKFEETNELLNLFYPLLYSKSVHAEEVDIAYLYPWFILCHADKYYPYIVSLFKNNYDLLEKQADRLLMNAGLQNGMVFTGHLSNRFYHTFEIEECKKLSLRCFNLLLKKYKLNNEQNEFGGWSTASQMLWGIHQNLYNGLSGIGLALMATVSDKVPDWDGCIY